MKTTIEIEDSLDERAAQAIEEVKEELMRYLNENKPDSLPDLGNDLDYSGAIHEIVDGSVPVYTREIEATWFLHGNRLESAYDDAGIGDDAHENNGHDGHLLLHRPGSARLVSGQRAGSV